MRATVKGISGVVVLLTAVACTQRLGNLTVASTKNIAISSFNPGTMQPKKTEGQDCKSLILFIPTGVPNLENAIDNAMANAGTGYNLMTDVVLSSKVWTVILYSQSCYVVTGNAYQLRVALRDGDQLRNLASANGTNGSDVRVDLNDGTSVTGAMVAFSSDRLAIRPIGAAEPQLIDRADVDGMTVVDH